MDGQTCKIVAKLDGRAVDEIERLAQIPAIVQRPGFKETVALLVVLTSSSCGSPDGDDSGGTPRRCKKATSSRTYLQCYQRLFTVFARITCSKHLIGGWKNCARPLMRQIAGSTEQHVAAALASAAGSTEREAPQYLWKLMESVAVEVPSNYSEGFRAALLYLLALDAAISFDKLVTDDVEIPCLLEMFFNSSPNNRRNVASLLGEYLALLRICQFKDYIGEGYQYICKTCTFDFSILKDTKEIKHYSVKTVGSTIAIYFDNSTERSDSLDVQRQFVHQEDEANIFLYDCNCDVCLQHPVRRVDVQAGAEFEEELQSLKCCRNPSLANTLRTIFLAISERQIPSVEIYLISGRLVFELRHALCTFSQEEFRGEKFSLRKFLAQNLASNLDDSEESPPGREHNSRPIETLRCRSATT